MTGKESAALVPELVTPPGAGVVLPAIIEAADERARRRFVEFFTAAINNPNTRAAYAARVGDFCRWIADYGLSLQQIDAVIIAGYIEHLQRSGVAVPTVKQALSAISMLFDYLVLGHVVAFNPAASVRGPKYIVRRGKTPVLSDDETRQLLDSIDTSELIGLRDRALIGVMVYSFGRVSAVAGMTVGSYFATGKRWTIRLREKGGKIIEVPAHHLAERYLDEYIEGAGIAGDVRGPLFRSFRTRTGILQRRKMHRNDVLRMVYRRAIAAGIDGHACCHTFRATGLTIFLKNGGALEKGQQIAGHASPRTTKLYDRNEDVLTLDEIERIRF